jgi:hypothetical protein
LRLQVEKLLGEKAGTEDLSLLRRSLEAALEARTLALRQDLTSASAATATAVARCQASVSAAALQLDQSQEPERLSELTSRVAECGTNLERLAEAVRADRSAARAGVAEVQRAASVLERALAAQWEETCRGLDLCQSVGRAAVVEVEARVVAVQDQVLQERVDRLEAINPLKEQMRQAVQQTEHQRGATRSGAEAAHSELSQQLRAELEATAGELREDFKKERAERLEKEREIVAAGRKVEALAADEHEDARRMLVSLQQSLQQVLSDVASTKTGLKKVDALQRDCQQLQRQVAASQRPPPQALDESFCLSDDSHYSR